jgi:6-pyruvoyltetrahydropterin/6-carboxytetrahydropterin synthase
MVERKVKMELKVKCHFDAAHFIPHHEKCGKIHGHRWEVEVTLEGRTREIHNGMLIDVGEIKSVLERKLHPFDHDLLNKTFFCPTMEVIALYLLEQLKRDFPFISAVQVWESPDCSVIVRKEDLNAG